jgi:hypothetical protein
VIRATAVGAVARAALARAGGRATPLAADGPFYLRADDAIIWLGGPGAILHPRAVIAAALPAARPARVAVDLTGARRWEPAPPVLAADRVAAFADGLSTLLDALAAETPARGLARLLFPLTTRADRLEAALLARARPALEALAAACESDAAPAAVEPATRLLGLGPGLTPAGDDVVGGALFARAVLGRSGAADRAAWAATAAAVVAAARERTHPVSAALLADLAAATGHAPLLDLVAALAEGRPDAALPAARRFVAIGHSSGWDVVAGLAAGTLGRRAFG